ncbi:hypothetical protein EB796_018150 [Bugula neritina]|uniref:Uncharacterized protein n=1 Tax=Bugula neritina TaxID=10212 RepID=A0A7J7JC99_BUGNE|nr:hypothetical protein EB796_018150 [Bugula neritina]
MVVLLMVIDGGAEKVKDTENLIEDITDKLDVAIKDSVKNIKISPDAQEALDEFGIELGVVDGDQPTQQKGSSAKPPTVVTNCITNHLSSHLPLLHYGFTDCWSCSILLVATHLSTVM